MTSIVPDLVISTTVSSARKGISDWSISTTPFRALYGDFPVKSFLPLSHHRPPLAVVKGVRRDPCGSMGGTSLDDLSSRIIVVPGPFIGPGMPPRRGAFLPHRDRVGRDHPRGARLRARAS